MELKFFNNNLEKITIEATNSCNLNCKTCFLTGIKNKKIKFFDNKSCNFSFKLFKKLTKQLKLFDSYSNITVNLSGGEPFLNPEILDILKYSGENNIRLMIFTNGTYDNKINQKLIRNNVFAVMFSIDGNCNDHGKNKGIGSFNKTLENIKYLQIEKRENNSYYPILAINTVISKLNINSFDSVFDLAQRSGCGVLSFSLVQWSNSLFIKKSIEEIRERFGIFEERLKLIKGLNHKFGDLEKRETDKIFNKVNLIKKKASENKPDIKLLFFPDFNSKKEYEKWFSDECYKINNCSNIFKQIRINHEGNVFPGCSISFYVLGNINKEPLDKILNGKKAKRLLSEVKKNGFFYLCHKCCRRPSDSTSI